MLRPLARALLTAGVVLALAAPAVGADDVPVLRLTPDRVATAAPGGRVEVTGLLSYGGSPLPDRQVVVELVRGVETTGRGTPDAGIATDDGLVLRHTVVTDADGRFAVTLVDPDDAAGPSEVGGRLLATLLDDARVQATPVPVRFGPRGTPALVLRAADNGLRSDVLRVAAPAWTAGERVRVLRVGRTGTRTVLATRRLDPTGAVPRLVVADLNGPDPTTYLVRLQPSERVAVVESPIRRVR